MQKQRIVLLKKIRFLLFTRNNETFCQYANLFEDSGIWRFDNHCFPGKKSSIADDKGEGSIAKNAKEAKAAKECLRVHCFLCILCDTPGSLPGCLSSVRKK